MKMAWLLVLVVVSGCAQDGSNAAGPTAGGPHGRGNAAATAAQGSSYTSNPRPGATTTAPRTSSASNLRPDATTTFANLPDRGDLVAYLRPAVRRHGAYTWHAVELSETHAMRAVVTGEMTVSAPDGTPIRLQYDRHVEHADGNWTWVGHTPEGEQALITFGDSAAFGSIPQGRGRAPLRLTVSDGRSWMVSVDRDKLEAVDNEATDPTAPDFLIPPRLGAGQVPTTGKPPVFAAPAATAAATNALDLLVGYTPGFAASIGGQSAAVTRIRNLVDIANQAYINSQVDLQLRLVHAMQVNYPDATDNGDTLGKLTGNGAAPAAEFAALRAARDQYGADLVSLIRDFRTPENGGCGTAWLLGSGGREIVPGDEYYGYSVVSDGQDADSDGTYFCRDETLAHELGHNLGSTHDAAAAGSQSGRFSYSYGYKATPSTGDFYTVMAYGDSGQRAYRVFSNPRIDFCGGRACGASQADVARSLGQTSPIIAGFRAAMVEPSAARARLDFDADGQADLLWRNRTTGGNTIWRSADSAADHQVAAVPNLSWSVAGTGDFNGDNRSDILWRDRDTGRNVFWASGSARSAMSLTRVNNFDWDIAGTGDFDGDGRDDILWRNRRTGANTIWRSASSGSGRGVTRVNNLAWTVAGVADFNGDGQADILWRNTASGANTIWLSGNSTTDRNVTRVNNFDWTVAGLGDFDGDGQDDILWRNRSTGANTVWRSADSASSQAVASLSSRAWQVAGVDDFDGDGRFDILWRNVADGANSVWRSGNSTTVIAVTAVPNLAWRIEGSPTG